MKNIEKISKADLNDRFRDVLRIKCLRSKPEISATNKKSRRR